MYACLRSLRHLWLAAVPSVWLRIFSQSSNGLVSIWFGRLQLYLLLPKSRISPVEKLNLSKPHQPSNPPLAMANLIQLSSVETVEPGSRSLQLRMGCCVCSFFRYPIHIYVFKPPSSLASHDRCPLIDKTSPSEVMKIPSH